MDDHIYLPFNKIMKVILAAQVLNQSESGRISTLVRTSYLHKEAIHAVRFVKMIKAMNVQLDFRQ